MRKFLRTKSSILVASIFALGATLLTGCDNSSETKAVDRVEEAAALARVKDLEARADALKGNMPAANDITAGGADAASGKPSIKMPDESTIPNDEMALPYAAVYSSPIILIKSCRITLVTCLTVPAVT